VKFELLGKKKVSQKIMVNATIRKERNYTWTELRRTGGKKSGASVALLRGIQTFAGGRGVVEKNRAEKLMLVQSKKG